MSTPTYIAAPAGMTAHSFDNEGTLHSLSVAAWWESVQPKNHEHPDPPPPPPGLYPVVVTPEGTLRAEPHAVVTGPGQLPSSAELVARLLDRLQIKANTPPISLLPVGEHLDEEQMREAARHTGQGYSSRDTPMDRLLSYLEGEGAHDMAVLGRRVRRTEGTLIIADTDESTHTALDAARDAMPVLVERGRVRER